MRAENLTALLPVCPPSEVLCVAYRLGKCRVSRLEYWTPEGNVGSAVSPLYCCTSCTGLLARVVSRPTKLYLGLVICEKQGPPLARKADCQLVATELLSIFLVHVNSKDHLRSSLFWPSCP